MRTRAYALIALFLLPGWLAAKAPQAGKPAATQPAAERTEGAPLFKQLGSHHHTITTANPQAQRFFDQGLILVFAFNHPEAIRSFQEAARLDPQCAMAWWGVALAYGPNINQPMPDEAVGPAWEALQKALQLAPNASDQERAYIEALALRYLPQPPKDRAKLDLAYADAMRQVAQRYPDDLDAQTLFAEALMDTMPWEYWTKEGQPKPATREVLASLETVLAKDPDHPGANHYYIHAVEASPNPERALASAHRLGNIAPDAGHLVHMPAHIYLRLGMYHDATLANERAIAADQSYISQCAAQGYYPKLYVPHNIHFLWYATSMEGRSQEAMAAARQTSEYVSKQGCCVVEKTAQFPLPLLTMIRFGQWEAVLEEAKPAADNLYAVAIWHYGRGLALAAKGRFEEARRQQADLHTLATGEEARKLDEPFFPGTKVLGVMEKVLAGEIAARQGSFEQAIPMLRQAAQLEDELPYMEPPYWYIPVRQVLGAVLLEANRPAEAEAVYREDLKRHPENGWSLFGLLASLRDQGKSAEADEVQQRFRRAWAHADVMLTASRF